MMPGGTPVREDPERGGEGRLGCEAMTALKFIKISRLSVSSEL
jgi:hypothetical protein